MAKKKKKKITQFEWEMLVGAWRYYENRSTIAAVSFPSDIVRHYFKGDYEEDAMRQIARQFSVVDHGLNGINDWKREENEDSPTGKWKHEYHHWLKFFAFCKAYINGFTTLTLEPKNGKRESFKAFYLETSDRWYDIESYLDSPYNEIFLNSEYIVAQDNEKDSNEANR